MVYDTHTWVCFPCRKSVKKPRIVQNTASGRQYLSFPCAFCRKEMTPMGRAFRPPTRANLEQWRKVEKLRRAGIWFQGSSSEAGRELLPRHERDVDAFLRRAAAASRAALPPEVRFWSGWRRAPYARRSFKKLRIGQGTGAEVPVNWMSGVWVELTWRSRVGLFITGCNLPRCLVVNGKAMGRLPWQLRSGDWLSVGGRSSRGVVVVEW